MHMWQIIGQGVYSAHVIFVGINFVDDFKSVKTKMKYHTKLKHVLYGVQYSMVYSTVRCTVQ